MELLVVLKDKHPFDRRFHVRGDVIVAMPNKHRWGRDERNNPDWAIVHVAGLLPDEAATLTAPQPHLTEDPTEPKYLRHFGLNLEALDISRTVKLKDFRTAIVVRPRIRR